PSLLPFFAAIVALKVPLLKGMIISVEDDRGGSGGVSSTAIGAD
ncbi:hypothetical protein Tco_1542943, partial [Tanacetum coccineum]